MKKVFLILAFVLAVTSFYFSQAYSANVNRVGLRLFSSEGCINCHSINGVGGTAGPNLSNIGSKEGLAWIKEQVSHPSRHFMLGTGFTQDNKTYVVIMPPFKVLPSSKINALAEYLESLKGKTLRQQQLTGEQLFVSKHCIACHTVNGIGGTAGPNLSNIGSKESLAWIKEQIIYPAGHYISKNKVKIKGKIYHVIMPDHLRMSPSKVDAIASYLKSLK
ncbi:MAG: c-type cytochrome [bacterium]